MTAVTSAVLFRSESKGSGSTPMDALKGRFPLGGIFRAERHFQLENSALNFDLISTSILPKTKTVRKRRNKMSAVEKRSALKKLLALIALEDVFKGKSKNTGEGFGSDGLLKNKMKKDNFKNLSR